MVITKTKTQTETYEILDVAPNFGKYGDLMNRRQELYGSRKDRLLCKCLICNYKFGDDDNVNLALIKGKKNMLICDKCYESGAWK